jgi:hypothetical protein
MNLKCNDALPFAILAYQGDARLSALQFVANEGVGADIAPATAAAIEARELDDGGRINRLRVVNVSSETVALLEGTTFVGGYQNRAIVADLALEPTTEADAPVVCVERGRWDHEGVFFEETTRVLPPSARARHAEANYRRLERGEGKGADQSDAWRYADERLALLGADSPTEDLVAAIDAATDRFGETLATIEPNERADGWAFFAGGRLLCVETFGTSALQSAWFAPALRAATTDALDADETRTFGEEEAALRAANALREAARARGFTREGVLGGTERFFRSATTTGTEFTTDGKLVRLSAFPLPSRRTERGDEAPAWYRIHRR